MACHIDVDGSHLITCVGHESVPQCDEARILGTYSVSKQLCLAIHYDGGVDVNVGVAAGVDWQSGDWVNYDINQRVDERVRKKVGKKVLVNDGSPF